MKYYLRISIVFLGLIFGTFSAQDQKNTTPKENIEKLLNNLNQFAADAQFDKYFNLYDEESTFIGTDAKEIWDKKAFMEYAKPHFEKRKTWNFKSLKRNIFISEDGRIAWFDELLDTQMKICRGSGVLYFNGKDWKIKQYVLSVTVPNEEIEGVIKLKNESESQYIKELKLKK